MDGITVKKADPYDADAAFEAFYAMTKEEKYLFVPGDPLFKSRVRSFYLDLVKRFGSDGQYFAFVGAEPAGFIWVWKTSQPITGETIGIISSLYVYPQFRRKGVGRKLVLQAEEYCRREGLGTISLHVFIGNLSAENLYGRLGYSKVSTTMEKKF